MQTNSQGRVNKILILAKLYKDLKVDSSVYSLPSELKELRELHRVRAEADA